MKNRLRLKKHTKKRVKNPLRYKQPVWRTLYGKNNPCVEPFYGKNNPCEEPFTVQTTRVQNPLRYKQPVWRTLYDTKNTCEEPFTKQTTREEPFTIQTTRVKNPLPNNSPCTEPFTIQTELVYRGTTCTACTGKPRVRRVRGNHVYGMYRGTRCTACTACTGEPRGERPTIQTVRVYSPLPYRQNVCKTLYDGDSLWKKKTMAVQTACGKTPDDTISLWQNHLRHRQPVAKHYDIDSL